MATVGFKGLNTDEQCAQSVQCCDVVITTTWKRIPSGRDLGLSGCPSAVISVPRADDDPISVERSVNRKDGIERHLATWRRISRSRWSPPVNNHSLSAIDYKPTSILVRCY